MILLFFILPLTSCLKEEVPFHYTLCINIYDARTNDPVQRSNVYLYSKSGSTYHKEREQVCIDGYCEFTGLDRKGDYLIRVKCASDYSDGEWNISLTNDAKNLISIPLEPF